MPTCMLLHKCIAYHSACLLTIAIEEATPYHMPCTTAECTPECIQVPLPPDSCEIRLVRSLTGA